MITLFLTIDFRLYEATVEASSVKVAKILSGAFPAKIAGLFWGAPVHSGTKKAQPLD
jgi:hypothetical protein